MFTKADAEAYFNGEKQDSLIFLILGVLAITAALLLWFYFKNTMGKGAAWPLMLIGLLQLVVGFTVYARSDAQRKDIVYKMDMNPDVLQKKEIPRMQKVMQQFVIYRYAEILLLIVGIATAILLFQKLDKQFWVGVGIGLAIQTSLMLVADSFAERRGHKYLTGLEAFLKGK